MLKAIEKKLERSVSMLKNHVPKGTGEFDITMLQNFQPQIFVELLNVGVLDHKR